MTRHGPGWRAPLRTRSTSSLSDAVPVRRPCTGDGIRRHEPDREGRREGARATVVGAARGRAGGRGAARAGSRGQRQRSTRGDTRKRERPSRARHEVAGRTAARAQERGEWPEHHAATGNGADRATTRRGDRPHGEISIPPGRGVYPSWRPPARRLANRRRLVLVRRRPIRVPRREGSCRP